MMSQILNLDLWHKEILWIAFVECASQGMSNQIQKRHLIQMPYKII